MASQLAAGLAACGLAVCSVAACAHAPASARAKTDAIVYVKSNVPDAQLYVDGKFVASLEALRGGIAIEPGAHRLELRREDYFSSYLELTVARAERKQIAIDLAAILP